MSTTTYTITSPVMGIFYRAAAPGEEPLVEVGQKINTTNIVCMIESMKIFTELRPEKAGIIKKILIENEEPVMKNQALIDVEITD